MTQAADTVTDILCSLHQDPLDSLSNTWEQMATVQYYSMSLYKSTFTQKQWFLLCDTMQSSCVCHSVRPSIVTSRHCTKTAKCRIRQTTPYDRRGRFQIDNFRPVSQKWCKNIKIKWWKIKGHSYYGMLIGSCMCSIEWCYFQWPSVTPNYCKPPHFLYFVSPFISS